MAYFRDFKLDPGFENWLDAKILKLKAEGVIESDPEEGGRPYTQRGGSLQGGLPGSGSGSGSESELWLEDEAAEEEEEEEWQEEEYVWGEDPTGEQEVGRPPLMTAFGSSASGVVPTMEEVAVGAEEENMVVEVKGGEKMPMCVEAAGDQYYHLTWEDEYDDGDDDDGEAAIFDREEYQLGHGDQRRHQGPPPPTGNYRPAAGSPRRRGSDNGDNKDGPGGTRPAAAADDNERGYADGTDDARSVAMATASGGLGGGLGGVVLGMGQRAVRAAYTKLPVATTGDGHRLRRHRDAPIGDARFEVYDTERLPDPRFSIGDRNDVGSHDVPMLEFAQSGERRREKNHIRSGHARIADVGGSGDSGRTCSTVPAETETGPVCGGQLLVPEYSVDGSRYAKDRILLPMDSMEMSMTSDDDDEAILSGDDCEQYSDTLPIVTLDQATLVQQWRAKSAHIRYAIVAALVAGLLLTFGLVIFFIVHILTTTW